MKPNYEKPIAVPLGEAVKGSGECAGGSVVLAGPAVQTCQAGPSVTNLGINIA